MCTHSPIGLVWKTFEFTLITASCNKWTLGAFLHCARAARYFQMRFSPKSPLPHPFQTPLILADPNYPSSRQLQATFPSHKTPCTMGKGMNGDGRHPGY